MEKYADRADVYFGDSVIRAVPLDLLKLGVQYTELMRRLYGERVPPLRYVEPSRMLRVLRRPNWLMSFVVLDGQLVSMADAHLIDAEPNQTALFGNIITRDGFDRRGLGSLAHDSLERVVCTDWGADAPLFLTLTNHERKGNSDFYRRRGWSDTGTTVFGKFHDPASARSPHSRGVPFRDAALFSYTLAMLDTG